METIIYENIEVLGVPFERILKLEITHKENQHALVNIKGQIKTNIANDLIKKIDDTYELHIVTTAKEQPSKLFSGRIKKMNIVNEGNYSILSIDGINVSVMLDTLKKNKTYQNPSLTHGEIFDDTIKGNGFVNVTVPDKAVNKFIARSNETDWEFICRLASHLNTAVFTNIISKKPQLYVGMPPTRNIRNIETTFYSYSKDNKMFKKFSENVKDVSVLGDDFNNQKVKSYNYAYIGDQVKINNKITFIKSVQAKLLDGILECTYELGLATSFIAPKSNNIVLSGKVMQGVVKEVKENKVKVFFNTLDSEYDSSTNMWFPYSTAYSSGDGSGIYCMPNVEDNVRVFFPSGDENDAFVASTMSNNSRENTKDKYWCGANGKHLLITPEGLLISCKDNDIYIKLSDEDGIEIISSQDVNITSMSKINIQSGDNICIGAENEVIIGTPSAYIDFKKEGITMTAKNVIVT